MTLSAPIVSGRNDLLFDDAGKTYVDLHTGFGAVFMGHCHPQITQAVARQVQALWMCGGAPNQLSQQALQALAGTLGPNFKTASLYSSGMEANEFVLRYARVATGKSGWVGFDGSMYGKSQATAALAWHNGAMPTPVGCHRLPFPGVQSEEQVLQQLHALLRDESIGAVFLEPILGSSGGVAASNGFYQSVAALAHQYGALVVLDEVLTGFYRTGTCFRFEALGLQPDVVVVGKACGNGFPVSAVMIDAQQQVTPNMLPGSTFSGNQLACASVVATLAAMHEGDMVARVQAISQTIQAQLGWLADSPLSLRGHGALWVIDGFQPGIVAPLLQALYQKGFYLSGSGRQIRLLPASTIEAAHLSDACAAVSASLRALI